MAMNFKKNTAYIGSALGTAFVVGLAASSGASAETGSNPFVVNDLGSGYMVAANHNEGTCGGEKEGEMEKKGEGTCGGEKEREMEKKGEGKCGGEKEKEMEKKGEEGKCGEGKCGA